MNRSIDSRSDLYALGVTLYELLTGGLPFTATDPMEWVHCHVARLPVRPVERRAGVPGVVSAVVMKLLAKTAEDRYQTAAGLESDVRRCLAAWEAHGRIDDFPLGEHDTLDRLLIPEKLYGREREIATLLASFDRVVSSGRPELVLVSGYSGIGKSSVVHELNRVLVPPRGLFASGKFDQYKRDIPYSTLAQAFQGLIRPLLSKSEGELNKWRDALHEALGPNGKLIVNLVPELQLIIGDPQPIPDLPLQDAQRRFHLVFRRFIGVFARPEHPLALFLDDLQWLDPATLDLIEDLLTQSDVRHVMLIGAYRDNEVNSSHPLMRKLEAIRKAGASVQEIVLAPLTREDLAQLTRDALHCEPERASALAELIHDKTAGNPFFAIQFIAALVEEGLVTFDYGEGRWSWDLNRIRAKGYTDNVVYLMVGKLHRLPIDIQEALQQLACLGHSAAITTLALVHGTSEEQVHAHLWGAVRHEAIERLGSAYRFIHDRVQEAAYALIPEEERAAAHLRIGRLLAAHTPPEKREEAIFELVNQLNRGAALITEQEEREQLAELNLIAGTRAKNSTAYASALTYLLAGAALLAEDCWERQHALAFALELHRADCELWTGALPSVEERLAALAARAVDTVQRAAVASRRVDLYTMLGASNRAVEVGLEFLRYVGIDWPAHPTEMEARREYERIWSQVGSRAIEELIDLPLMQDPESLATLDVLTTLGPPTLYTDGNLLTLTSCRAVNLSLERGNSDAAPAHYATVGLLAGDRFGDYDAGYRLAKMACDLTERRGLKRFGGKTYSVFALVVPWTRPVRERINPARRAFQMANEQGDPTFAAYACWNLTSGLLAAGDPLDQVEREAEQGLEFARTLRFGFVADMISAPLALVRTLRGETAKFGLLDDGRFTERSFEERMTGHPTLALPECFYRIRKLQARFSAGDYASAIEATKKAERWFSTSASLSGFPSESAEYHLYAALSRAACCEPMGPDPYTEHREALAAHDRQLRAWAANCPENFEDRTARGDGPVRASHPLGVDQRLRPP
jgi:predicted ATPase